MLQEIESLKRALREALVLAAQRVELDRLQELTNVVRALESDEAGLNATMNKATELLGRERGENVNEPPQEKHEKGPESGFPKFFVIDGVLIKEALRSDKNTTYLQRMPKSSFNQILETLRQILPTAEEFHVPAVVNGSDAPSYHVYMTLSVLQEAGYLDSSKRGQYRFLKRDDIQWGSGVWSSLPNKKQL